MLHLRLYDSLKQGILLNYRGKRKTDFPIISQSLEEAAR